MWFDAQRDVHKTHCEFLQHMLLEFVCSSRTSGAWPQETAEMEAVEEQAEIWSGTLPRNAQTLHEINMSILQTYL